MGLFDMAAALLISRTYCPWGGWTSLGIQISFPMFLVLYLDSEGAIASFREACRQSGNADNMPIAEARHPSDVPPERCRPRANAAKCPARWHSANRFAVAKAL